MNPDLSRIPEILRTALESRIAQLVEQGGLPVEGDASIAVSGSLPLVWACSDFAAEACLRSARLLGWLAGPGRMLDLATRDWLVADFEAGLDPSADDTAFMEELRRFRRRQLVRIAWRDLAECSSRT